MITTACARLAFRQTFRTVGNRSIGAIITFPFVRACLSASFFTPTLLQLSSPAHSHLPALPFAPSIKSSTPKIFFGTSIAAADSVLHFRKLEKQSTVFMKKISALFLICILSPLSLPAKTDAVTNAPGETAVLKKEAETLPDYPLAPKKYRRPSGFKPSLYKYSLKQMSEKFSEETIKAARAHTARVRATNEAGKWKPNGKSLDKHECPEWFKDAKFGIFIDWGLWSLASWCPPKKEGAMYPDWYELRMYSNFYSKSPFWGYRNYHIKNWGEDFQRDHFIPLFKASDFNSEELAELFSECGAKYVVPFSKHHSGFCLWPSSYTHRDVMDMGPKRDIMSPLAEACKKLGMKFGFYFSLSEWEYPLLKEDGTLANFSWNKEIPYSDDMEYKASGKIAVKDFVNEYIIPQAAEFIEKYSPDILWFDADWADKASALGGYDIAAYFYNISQKPVAVNDRYGLGEPDEIKGRFTAARPRL